MTKVALALGLAAMIAVSGCGSPPAATASADRKPGFVRVQKDKALDVASKQDDYNREGESVAYGDAEK